MTSNVAGGANNINSQSNQNGPVREQIPHQPQAPNQAFMQQAAPNVAPTIYGGLQTLDNEMDSASMVGIPPVPGSLPSPSPTGNTGVPAQLSHTQQAVNQLTDADASDAGAVGPGRQARNNRNDTHRGQSRHLGRQAANSHAQEMLRRMQEEAAQQNASAKDDVAAFARENGYPELDYGSMEPGEFFETGLGKAIKNDPEAMKAYSDAFNKAMVELKEKFQGVPGMKSFFKEIDKQVADVWKNSSILLAATGGANPEQSVGPAIQAQQVQESDMFSLKELVHAMKGDDSYDQGILLGAQAVDRDGYLDLNHIKLDASRGHGKPKDVEMRTSGDSGNINVLTQFKMNRMGGQSKIFMHVKQPGTGRRDIAFEVPTQDLKSPDELEDRLNKFRQAFKRDAEADENGAIRFKFTDFEARVKASEANGMEEDEDAVQWPRHEPKNGLFSLQQLVENNQGDEDFEDGFLVGARIQRGDGKIDLRHVRLDVSRGYGQPKTLDISSGGQNDQHQDDKIGVITTFKMDRSTADPVLYMQVTRDNGAPQRFNVPTDDIQTPADLADRLDDFREAFEDDATIDNDGNIEFSFDLIGDDDSTDTDSTGSNDSNESDDTGLWMHRPSVYQSEFQNQQREQSYSQHYEPSDYGSRSVTPFNGMNSNHGYQATYDRGDTEYHVMSPIPDYDDNGGLMTDDEMDQDYNTNPSGRNGFVQSFQPNYNRMENNYGGNGQLSVLMDDDETYTQSTGSMRQHSPAQNTVPVHQRQPDMSDTHSVTSSATATTTVTHHDDTQIVGDDEEDDLLDGLEPTIRQYVDAKNNGVGLGIRLQNHRSNGLESSQTELIEMSSTHNSRTHVTELAPSVHDEDDEDDVDLPDVPEPKRTSISKGQSVTSRNEEQQFTFAENNEFSVKYENGLVFKQNATASATHISEPPPQSACTLDLKCRGGQPHVKLQMYTNALTATYTSRKHDTRTPELAVELTIHDKTAVVKAGNTSIEVDLNKIGNMETFSASVFNIAQTVMKSNTDKDPDAVADEILDKVSQKNKLHNDKTLAKLKKGVPNDRDIGVLPVMKDAYQPIDATRTPVSFDV